VLLLNLEVLFLALPSLLSSVAENWLNSCGRCNTWLLFDAPQLPSPGSVQAAFSCDTSLLETDPCRRCMEELIVIEFALT
jgi:hypothetical protein